jgi:hypothetical protein
MAGARIPTRRRIGLSAALALGAASLLAPSPAAACSAPVQRDGTTFVTCSATAVEHAFVVPPGVRSLRVIAAGGSGGDGSPTTGVIFQEGGGPGGMGVLVSAPLSVKPGRKLYILVGGQGRSSGGPLPGAGGFNGGARGGSALRRDGLSNVANGAGGGGGGASDVRTCSVLDRSCNSLGSRLVVAAGGGGGGGHADLFGGAGGWAAIGDGDNGDGSPPDGGGGVGPDGGGGAGGGATLAAGGRAGNVYAAAGTRGAGGQGADSDASGEPGGGGGGGGGVLGGGGGAAGVDLFTSGAGGGAGASFAPRGARLAHASPGAGSVTIAYLATTIDQPPSVTVTSPRAGQVVRRPSRGVQRRVVLSGRATDPSGVQAVALTIQRLALPSSGGRAKVCDWVLQSGGTQARSCATPPTLFATVGSRGAWSYELPRAIPLPPGRYRISAYGADGTGLFGNLAPRVRRVVTFRLR